MQQAAELPQVKHQWWLMVEINFPYFSKADLVISAAVSIRTEKP